MFQRNLMSRLADPERRRSRVRRSFCYAMLVTLVATPVPAGAERPVIIDADWRQKWHQDLEFLRQELPAAHADLFHTLSETDFNAAIDDLQRRLPSLTHPQIIVRLAQIVASIGDGHTRLTLPMAPGRGFFQGHSQTPLPPEPAMLFHDFPIRLYQFEEGFFVQRVAPDHAWAAGARVTAIDGKPIEEVADLVTPMIQRDNASQIRHLLPQRLVVPEILYAVDVIGEPGEARFELRTTEGEVRTLTLEPVSVPQQVLQAHFSPGGDEGPAFTRSETSVREEVAEQAWVDAADAASTPTPLYLQRLETNYWMHVLADTRTLYVQYNECYDQGEETIAEFAERLLKATENGDVDRVVFDLRHNVGGNNGNNRPLLHAFIRSSLTRERGNLFVIIGRQTFSAALMLALDLEKHTPALFVGEPTGGKPNHYGDSRKLQLPNSGLTVRASSLYWQYSDPRDQRDAIPPHVPVAPTMAAYRQNLDPALEVIIGSIGARLADDQFAGEWRGVAGSTALIVRLNRDGGDWSGSLDVPDLGLADQPLIDVSVDDGRMRAKLVVGDDQVVLDGEFKDGLMFGTATEDGNVEEFVLRPPF